MDNISKDMHDFGWLEEQVKAVKTNNFFVIAGPVSKSLRKRIETSPIGVPSSYKSFVIQFGHSKLYCSRQLYMVEVFASPHEVKSKDGEDLLQFGKTDESPAYFKTTDLRDDGAEIPVYEWNPEDGLHKAFPGFEKWLLESCRIARRQFKKKRWAEIIKGPEPFSHEELKIIEARRLFHWKVVGIAEDGDLLLDITNRSTMHLSFLSVGVSGKKVGKGGVYVSVADIDPGEHKVRKVSCYKRDEQPRELELFHEPDPLPETRDSYWEFRPLEDGIEWLKRH